VLSLRVTRDRRGYDHIYLIEETRRRGRPEGRLLYWVRMPGGLRVGRDPFDDETRLRLERANPGVAFDWPSLSRTLASSLAAARWAARQQQEQRSGGGRPPGPPERRGERRGSDRDGGRSGGRPAPRRSWREDDDELSDDGEGAGAASGRRGAVADPAERAGQTSDHEPR
jgi:hypothetical protein